jgi:hypothetical protein
MKFKPLSKMHQDNLFYLMGSDELFESGIDLLLRGMERKIVEKQS